MRDRLIECFAVVFPHLERREIPRATMASVGEWDSLASVNIITVVQEEFGIQIAPEDFDSFASFDLIHDLVERNLDVSRG